MSRITSIIPLVFLAACSLSTQLGPGAKSSDEASSSSSAKSSGKFTVPALLFLTEADARAALEKAGHTGTVSVQNNLCGSTLDGKIVEKGVVCYQHPPAGRVQGARLPVQIKVQPEDPRHGSIGKNSEWHLMPDVVGLHLDKAQAEMRKAGFTNTERIRINRVSKPGCKPDHVCSTYPEALNRIGQNSDKVLSVGADPNAGVKKSPQEAKPTPRADEKHDEDDSGGKEDKAEDFF